uniref:Uncharacterized protein n=1 Tax=Rhizophora mucronata TaxID=61149 RepID=A0A2P2NW32_RHIMU
MISYFLRLALFTNI